MTKINGFLFSRVAPFERTASTTSSVDDERRASGGVLHRAVRFGWRVVLFACVFGCVAPSHAQDPPLLAKPDVNIVGEGGSVFAGLRLADGSTVFGGSFVSVDNVRRSSLFKRRPDGTLDADWNPAVDGAVYALATDAAGNIYAGGSFSEVNGVPRRLLVKLSAAGDVDPDWNASPVIGSLVYALAIDASGNVFVGGLFFTIGGQSRSSLAKLASTGSGAVDPNWNPGNTGPVYALAMDGTGNLFVGGDFTTVGGQSRRGLAKLSGSGAGAADPTWNPSLSGPSRDLVNALALDADGNLFAGGSFVSASGLGRSGIVKLSPAGVADPTWNPSPNGSVVSLATDATGNVWVGGVFTSIGGLSRLHVAKLSGTGVGAADPGWNPSPDEPVGSITVDAGGNVYIGGLFETVGGLSRLGFAAVSPAGVPQIAMDMEWPGTVDAFARQPDGSTIVGGDFVKADGQPRRYLLRLRADGTVDPDWRPSPDRRVYALATNAAGDVYVGGTFTTIDGQPRKGIAKLSGSGTGAVDPNWHPVLAGFSGSVSEVAMSGAGELYIAGSFTAVGGLQRTYLAKLSGSGTGAVDPVWNPSPNSFVDAMTFDAAGNLHVGGNFTNVGGVARQRLAKLATSGTGVVDPDWHPSPNDRVMALAINAAGDIVAGGRFTTIDGLPRQGIARLGGGSGAVDPSWNPSANDDVTALAIDSAGDVYVGGEFAAIGGAPRERIARVFGGGTGAADPSWAPFVGGSEDVVTRVTDLKIEASGNVWASGRFTSVDGQPRRGIAAFGVKPPDLIFVDGFE